MLFADPIEHSPSLASRWLLWRTFEFVGLWRARPRSTRHVSPRGMRRVMIVLLAFSAAEALLLTPPVPRLSAGAVTPRSAAASTMQLDVIPLCDSTSPGFIASRFVMPAVGGSVLAGLVRRPVTKLVVGVAALFSVIVLCTSALEPASCRAVPRVPLGLGVRG